MKELGYGKGYQYAHDYEGAVTDQQHLPDALRKRRYYVPSDRGQEKDIKRRMEEVRIQNPQGSRRKTE